MKYVLPYIHFSVFLLYLHMAALALRRNPGANLNRVAAGFLTCFAIWSFGNVFFHNPAVPRETVRFFVNFNSIGWSSLGSVFLIFVLIFSEVNLRIPKKLVIAGLLIIPVIFIYKQWTGGLIADLVKLPFGWGSKWSDSLWTSLFDVYYISAIGAGLVVLLVIWRKSQQVVKRNQAKILFLTGSVSLVSGILLSGFFPRIGIYSVPEVANWAALFWGVGMTYAIVKYKFLTITPALAAENIISTMSDFLVLLNGRGDIVAVNRATLNSLGYKEHDLLNQPYTLLLQSPIQSPGALLEHPLQSRRTLFVTRTGQVIPVLMSTSLLWEENGAIAGVVCAAKDITRIRQAEVERERLIDELQQALKRVNTLQGLIPICASCKKIRDDQGYWHQLEIYLRDHSDAEFSHGICDECARKLYPEEYARQQKKEN